MILSTAHRRRLAAASVLAAVLALAACTSEADVVPPSEGASPTAGADGTLPPTDLSFAAGAELVAGEWVPQWGDSFAADDGFTVGSADDGQGNWSYIQTATQCEISFSQGGLGGLDAAAGDAALSDELLARFLQATPAEVTPHTADDTLLQAVSGSASVDVRTVAGTSPDSGASWIMSARGFGSLDAGLLVGVVCPAGVDAVAQRDALRDSHLRIVLVPQQ
ncbi:hypothetical protein [Microbacterium sp. RU33B]|uniref:hypothetical protein n=1 Tax=Microbacterium sp. RU33B TaxID=1907390 RepID=UPI0009757C76|nr:hypothetical protein [Microbacterium sp. RU33B]